MAFDGELRSPGASFSGDLQGDAPAQIYGRMPIVVALAILPQWGAGAFIKVDEAPPPPAPPADSWLPSKSPTPGPIALPGPQSYQVGPVEPQSAPPETITVDKWLPELPRPEQRLKQLPWLDQAFEPVTVVPSPSSGAGQAGVPGYYALAGAEAFTPIVIPLPASEWLPGRPALLPASKLPALQVSFAPPQQEAAPPATPDQPYGQAQALLVAARLPGPQGSRTFAPVAQPAPAIQPTQVGVLAQPSLHLPGPEHREFAPVEPPLPPLDGWLPSAPPASSQWAAPLPAPTPPRPEHEFEANPLPPGTWLPQLPVFAPRTILPAPVWRAMAPPRLIVTPPIPRVVVVQVDAAVTLAAVGSVKTTASLGSAGVLVALGDAGILAEVE